VRWLAPLLFVAANAIVGLLVARTVALLVRGRLLPVATPSR
jgi:tellurite resistance protein